MKLWQQLAGKLDVLSRRERAMVFFAVLVVIAGGWNYAFLTPRQAQDEKAQQAAQAVQAQILALEAQFRAIGERAKHDPNQPLRSRRQQLNQQLTAVDDELQTLTGKFVAPEDMGPMLSDLLEAQRGLSLLRLESLPPVPLQVEGGEGAPTLFQHGLEVEFRGDYMSTLRFLQAVEALPWRLFWDRFEYELQSYPNARVVLRIHTLSPREDWIGV